MPDALNAQPQIPAATTPPKRKSVEPMGSHLDLKATGPQHPSREHFVANSAWSDEEMLLTVAQWVVPARDFNDGGWWIIDDTGFSKQGLHSVGVAPAAPAPCLELQMGRTVQLQWWADSASLDSETARLAFKRFSAAAARLPPDHADFIQAAPVS